MEQALVVKYDRQPTPSHPGVTRIFSLSTPNRDDSWLGCVCPMSCEMLAASSKYFYKLTHILRLFLQL